MKSNLLPVFFLLALSLHSQTDTESKPTNTKVEGTIFFNYHTETVSGESQFDINRAYLGATNKFDSIWKASILIDIGSPDDVSVFAQQRRYAYFRRASVEGTFGNFRFFTGIIDMNTYKESESLWGKRYLYKSMQDEFRFGVSADLGIGAEYTLSGWGSVDLLVVNGKGYNQMQTDNTFKVATGISFMRFSPFFFRIYADLMKKSIVTANSSILVGVKAPKIKGGAEVVMRTNDKYRNDYNRYGFSIFSTYTVMPKINLFARYDYRWSKELDGTDFPWDLRNDGSAMVAGVEYVFNKHIRASVNYQDWVAYAKNLPDKHLFYGNVEIKF